MNLVPDGTGSAFDPRWVVGLPGPPGAPLLVWDRRTTLAGASGGGVTAWQSPGQRIVTSIYR